MSQLDTGTHTIFRGSSVVEQVAVNDLVVGSNPTRGARLVLLEPAKTTLIFKGVFDGKKL